MGKIFLAGVVVVFAGWMSGYPIATIAGAALLYGCWHLVNLLQLHRWTLDPNSKLPRSMGLWASIFGGLNAIKKNERHRQDQQRTEVARLQTLIDLLPDALLVTNEKTVIVWGNESASRMLKFRIPEDYGKQLSTVVRDPDLAGWLSNNRDSKQPLDMSSPSENGHWITISEVPLQKNMRMFILRNVTGIHDVEQIRRDFVANISHELRTPLTVLRGYLELLDDHPSDEVRESIKKMLGQALQMQTLLDNLLELSRLQYDELSGQDEWVDVPDLLMRLEEQARDFSRGHHEIRFDVDNQLFLAGISADLESAFSNLITNAIKYTPKNGRVTVTWERCQDGAQLEVLDTGIGIPRNDIPRVTERFYRVGSDRARETGGTGLGLSIVKHVLNAHQARLSITSELTVGSKITCSFPRERVRSGHAE